MKLALINLSVLAAIACTGGNAAASVIINFENLPNGAGIHLTGFDINGDPFDVNKPNAGVFYLSSPAIPPGYPADATLSHIGITQTGNYYLADILESPGGSLSAQVWVHRTGPSDAYTVMDFIADPSQFVTGLTPTTTSVATGNLENVLNYLNDRGEPVSISVQVPLVATPEPATLTLFGLGLVGLAGNALRRRKWGTNQSELST